MTPDLPPADRIDDPPAALRGLTRPALLATVGMGALQGLALSLLTGALWPPLAPAALLGTPLVWVWVVSGLYLRLSAGLPRRVAARRLLRRAGVLSRRLSPPVPTAPCRYVPCLLPRRR